MPRIRCPHRQQPQLAVAGRRAELHLRQFAAPCRAPRAVQFAWSTPSKPPSDSVTVSGALLSGGSPAIPPRGRVSRSAAAQLSADLVDVGETGPSAPRPPSGQTLQLRL